MSRRSAKLVDRKERNMAKSDNLGWLTSTSTGAQIVTSTTSTTAMGSVSFAPLTAHGVGRSESEIDRAVYAHIQAIRALGRESITTVEIASALSLPPETVLASVVRL